MIHSMKRSEFVSFSLPRRWVMIVACSLSLGIFRGQLFAEQPQQKEWSIPAGGNTYRTTPNLVGEFGLSKGTLSWDEMNEVYSLYFHVDRSCDLKLSLEARSKNGTALLSLSVANQPYSAKILKSDFALVNVGDVSIKEPGYVRVDLKGQELAGKSFGEIKGLVVRSATEGLKVTCVANNEGNMFYWGRRGPSVHLTYTVPKDVDLEYAYSEVVVAEGDDPIGSYFMANGFREGYFGFQVNSDSERRILFSVWSPFQTDNPRDIPKDQRVEMLERGPQVKTGEFGNEGSGGQSFLIYPWKPGRVYRFLTQVKPEGNGNTTYACWFGDKQSDEWRLIAVFRRPKTDTHLKGFHSFLENFSPQTGHIARRGQYQNIWVRDTQGHWHESLSARFSVDATGNGGHRLDFIGGAVGDYFFLRNCGFFSASAEAGTTFTRDPNKAGAPNIDFLQLPRS